VYQWHHGQEYTSSTVGCIRVAVALGSPKTLWEIVVRYLLIILLLPGLCFSEGIEGLDAAIAKANEQKEAITLDLWKRCKEYVINANLRKLDPITDPRASQASEAQQIIAFNGQLDALASSVNRTQMRAPFDSGQFHFMLLNNMASIMPIYEAKYGKLPPFPLNKVKQDDKPKEKKKITGTLADGTKVE
jgi:hypothetical protein